MGEEASIEFRLGKIDETRNYLLDEMKSNNLVSENYKKKRKYLNYVENLIICAAIGIMSSEVGKKFLQSLQELKSISQL